MKVTLLGCGTSVGVPALGRAGWGACDPEDPRNRRQRCAVLVQTESTTVLVDAGPDIRNQLLPLGLKRIDALLITHTHSDHVAGLDDLRAFYWPDRVELPVRTTATHTAEIQDRFHTCLKRNQIHRAISCRRCGWIHRAGSSITIGDIDVDIFTRTMEHILAGVHVQWQVCLFHRWVGLADSVLDAISGVPLWIVEALRETPHQSHSHYEQTFAWIDRVQPERAVLTHLGLETDYQELAAICPPKTEPGVDGMVFDL